MGGTITALVPSSQTLLLLSPLWLLLLWRLWRFTIQPLLNTKEPRELPYWIPFLGHANSYIRDAYSTLTYGRLYFGDDRKPFSITLGGEVMYIITAPQDVVAAYRNTPSLTMDVFLRDLMAGFDVTSSALDKVYWKPNRDGSGSQLLSGNPHYKPLAHLTVDFYREQLYPGPRLTELGEITCTFIEESVRWPLMTDPRYLLSDVGAHKDISLLHWCEDILLRAAARSIFGDALLELNPSLLEDFLAFDNVSWKLMYRYPRFLSQDMHKSKDALVSAVQRYFELPKDQRPGASWFIEMQEAEMKALGISVLDISKFIALIYWVVNTNAYKLLFWMLAFLLHDPELVSKVTSELQDSFRPDGSLDIASLQNYTPHLTALWHETLRMCNSSASARYVTADTQIGEYTLRAGRRLLIPYRQLHQNKAIFGANAAEFDMTRFLKDTKLAQNPSYRPFGGGVTYCPGRFLAKQEIFMALAFLLCRHDVELPLAESSDGSFRRQPFPKMDELKPGIGIIGPIDGDDLTIRLSPKKLPAVVKQRHPNIGWCL